MSGCRPNIGHDASFVERKAESEATGIRECTETGDAEMAGNQDDDGTVYEVTIENGVLWNWARNPELPLVQLNCQALG